MAVSDLSELLKRMEPELKEGRCYVATADRSQLVALANYLDYVLCVFREEEGLTVVFSGEIKDEIREITEKEVVGPFALITLTVHSDLLAVGFLARITEALAKEKISVNAFSAYHHDHLLVPFKRKDDTLRALKKLSER